MLITVFISPKRIGKKKKLPTKMEFVNLIILTCFVLCLYNIEKTIKTVKLNYKDSETKVNITIDGCWTI